MQTTTPSIAHVCANTVETVKNVLLSLGRFQGLLDKVSTHGLECDNHCVTRLSWQPCPPLLPCHSSVVLWTDSEPLRGGWVPSHCDAFMVTCVSFLVILLLLLSSSSLLLFWDGGLALLPRLVWTCGLYTLSTSVSSDWAFFAFRSFHFSMWLLNKIARSH